MVETKAKKPVRRVAKKAANAPEPTGPISDMGAMGSTCGHSGCKMNCQVRFVGPTTSVRDHHIVHAARGASQVWTAAIVAGLAVVLTGALAFTSVQAQAKSDTESSNASVAAQLANINRRLDVIEGLIRKQMSQTPAPTPAADQQLPLAKPADARACLDACSANTLTCKKAANEDEAALKACAEQSTACRKACAPAVK